MKQENIEILFSKLDRHIERCEKLPGYKVYIYVKHDNLDTLNNYVMLKVLKKITTDYVVQGHGINVEFSNGSKIVVKVFNETLRAVKTHVLFVDNTIREAELRPVATGSIIPYETETGGMILTPKPIFFSLE